MGAGGGGAQPQAPLTLTTDRSLQYVTLRVRKKIRDRDAY